MPAGFLVARGWKRWVLLRLGAAALTMPWRRVYVLGEWASHDGLIAHERVHLDQIERDGPVKFTILYLWWLVRYGYERNPYEEEAYAKAPID